MDMLGSDSIAQRYLHCKELCVCTLINTFDPLVCCLNCRIQHFTCIYLLCLVLLDNSFVLRMCCKLTFRQRFLFYQPFVFNVNRQRFCF